MTRAMRRFWDRRAREDAFHFIDNRQEYGRPDLRIFWAGGERALDELLDRLGAQLGDRDVVVEIGCGVGRMTRPIAARARRVRAVDIAPRMIELAREHNRDVENVDWIVGDGTTLAGIEDATADACISHVVFQHLPDPRLTYGYVREMGRVLRPGGWAAFQVSDDPAVHRRRGLREWLALRRRRGPRGSRRAEWLGSAVDLGDLRTAAHEGSLSVERVEGAGTQECFVLTRRT